MGQEKILERRLRRCVGIRRECTTLDRRDFLEEEESPVTQFQHER